MHFTHDPWPLEPSNPRGPCAQQQGIPQLVGGSAITPATNAPRVAHAGQLLVEGGFLALGHVDCATASSPTLAALYFPTNPMRFSSSYSRSSTKALSSVW